MCGSEVMNLMIDALRNGLLAGDAVSVGHRSLQSRAMDTRHFFVRGCRTARVRGAGRWHGRGAGARGRGAKPQARRHRSHRPGPASYAWGRPGHRTRNQLHRPDRAQLRDLACQPASEKGNRPQQARSVCRARDFFSFLYFLKIKISKIYVRFEIFQKYPRSPHRATGPKCNFFSSNLQRGP